MVEPPRWADVMLAVQQVGERRNRTLSELMDRGGLHHSELSRDNLDDEHFHPDCRATPNFTAASPRQKSAVIKHADDDARVRHAPETPVCLADG